MKIFNETKNKYVQATMILMNRIYHGEIIPLKSFDLEFLEEAGDNGSGLGLDYLDRLKKEYRLFDFSDKNRVKLCVDAPVPILPSLAEQLWLELASGEELMQLFMPAQKLELLKAKLPERSGRSLRDIIDVKGMTHTADRIDTEFIGKFRTILNAVQNHRFLHFINQAGDGSRYVNEAVVPVKIEYSVIQQKLRVSIWLPKEQRPIKANLESMQQVCCGDIIPELQLKSVKEMLEQRKAPEPLLIKVFNRNNAVERASLLFSQYDRKSRWESEDALLMEIEYYVFDEEELLSNILSFGPMMKVIGPGQMIENVKTMIMK